MRTNKAIKNIKVNFIFSITTLGFSFISRAIFIKYLGETFLGFNQLMISILGILNLAEAGVATAINFALYKPISSKDITKVDEIMYIYKYLYRLVGIVISILGIVISFMLPLFLKEEIDPTMATIYFLIFLFSITPSYFIGYKQTLAVADQSGYIISTINGISMIFKNILQILVLVLYNDYLIWLIINLVVNILNWIIINKIIDKKYNIYTFKSNKSIKALKEEYNQVFLNIKRTFIHKFSEVINAQLTPILINAVATLKEIAQYSNYLMITNGVFSFVGGVIQSFAASVGNLISEDDDSMSYNIFKELNMFTNFIASVLSISILSTVDIFIKLWVGEGYAFPFNIEVLLIINFYILINKSIVNIYKEGYGAYWDWGASLIESLSNIIISLILGNIFGIGGVFVGMVLTNFCFSVIWKPFVIYHQGFKTNVIKYYCIYLINISITALTACLSINLIKSIQGYIDIPGFLGFILMGGISFVFSATLIFIIFLYNKDFRKFVNRGKNIIINRFR